MGEMTITELINKFEDLKREYGDLPVCIFEDYTYENIYWLEMKIDLPSEGAAE